VQERLEVCDCVGAWGGRRVIEYEGEEWCEYVWWENCGDELKCNVELGLAPQTFIQISVIPFNVRIIALQLSKIHCRGKNINH